MLSANPLMSRVFIDLFGSVPAQMVISRNNYERAEHLLSTASFMVMGVLMPILLGMGVARHFTPRLVKTFNLPATANPMALPFKWLEKSNLDALKGSITAKDLAVYGFSDINQLTPALMRKARNLKIAIILVDLMLVAVKGQVVQWGKNWMTRRLSGKEGYSGIFNESSAQYRKAKTQGYEKAKLARLIVSFTLGFGSALLLPALLLGSMKSAAPLGKGFMGKFKNRLHWFDYTDIKYVSKPVLFWQALFNYNIPSLLSSRDSNELREKATKSLVFDTFYFVGDGIFAGLMARYLQKIHPKIDVPLFNKMKLWWGGNFPKAVPLHKMYNAVGPKAPAFNQSRIAFWTGMIGTTACMSVALPIMNVLFTRYKVRQEERKMAMTKPFRPLLNHLQ